MSINKDTHEWRTRWVMRRNAILGSAGFQRWASRMPIFRGVARRRAAAQFDLVAGFVYSQILAAHVQSGLIEYLTGELRSFDEITAYLKLKPDATERLLRAGQALQLVESPQAGLWTLGETGAPLSSNIGAMAMIRHHHLLYHDLTDPLALLAKDRAEETALSGYWTYASKAGSQSGAQGYSALMAATQPMVSQQIIDSYDFSQHRRMLDIGGGSGGFTLAIAKAASNLNFGIFDLPEVVETAKVRIAGTTNVTLHPGSFKTDALPGDYDLVTLVRILHDHDDDVVTALLAKIRAALPAGGRLLIVEPMAETSAAPRMGDAYFGLYLWAMGSGRPRSLKKLQAMLANAGFSSSKEVKTAQPIITRALVAFR
jgi:demethylspheroidene O-methyltransferase